MSTAEGHSSQEAIEGATIDELVTSELLTPEKLVAQGMMQEGEDMSALIDIEVISLRNLAGMGFKINAAEAAVLTAEAQVMLVAARIICDPESLLLECHDAEDALRMERALIGANAVATHRDGTQEILRELKKIGRTYVAVLMQKGLLTPQWLMAAGIVQEGETRSARELIDADVITMDALREKGFKITAEALRSLSLGVAVEKLFTIMGLVEEPVGGSLT